MEDGPPHASPRAVGIAFAMCAAAGLCTVLGGALVFCIKTTNHRFLSASLGLAAGVMVYISFVEILSVKAVGAFEESGLESEAAQRFATLGFFGGVLLTLLLDKAADKMLDVTERLQQRRGKAALPVDSHATLTLPDLEAPSSSSSSSKDAGSPAPPRRRLASCEEALRGPASLCAACAAAACDGASDSEGIMAILALDSAKLSRLGLLAALAVGIHNLPEGLATFISAMASPSLGAVIVVAIALHNLPEGICIALPIFYATNSRWRAITFCLVAGLAEPVGGLVGWGVLAHTAHTPLALAVLFSAVAGMMVYISLGELLPTAFKYDRSGRLALSGLFSGMVIMASSLLLFSV